MEVADTHNVKVYNLSSGKSVPEWLSERERRIRLKKDAGLRRRIQLIQDFEMPAVSDTVRYSKDGNYILATGIYKPRVKCFDVNNLSLKFERCFDAEAVTFEVLSDDYSKLVFLQCDRYVEFHSPSGRLDRLRVPKYGRDMKYHYASADLFVVGSSSEIYRINLERGQFMPPYQTTVSAINKCVINPMHGLLICGTEEGTVEAWDPRSQSRVGSLDVAFSCINENRELRKLPSVTALQFQGGLTMGVGTATGQVLLYDIRSNKPFYIKDHMYGLPIKDVEFHQQRSLVFSMDESAVKIWDRNNGKLFTSISSGEGMNKFNNLCVVPDTGLLFMANENPKIQTYYIPSLGPAPQWARFLDSLTEELEETNFENVYQDYKFITEQELQILGLEHLKETPCLRSYMHGYFMDIRLYKKVRAVAKPFEFEEFRKQRVRETIEKNRVNRVQIQNAPKVNKELAQEIMNDKQDKRKVGLLESNSYKVMFEEPDYEIDINHPMYKLLNPVLDKAKEKRLRKELQQQAVEEELEGKNSSEESSSGDEDSSDSDDYITQKDNLKKRQMIQKKNDKSKELVFTEYQEGEDFNRRRKINKAPLGERIAEENSNVPTVGTLGCREMTFTRNKKNKYSDLKNKQHLQERKQIVRSANVRGPHSFKRK